MKKRAEEERQKRAAKKKEVNINTALLLSQSAMYNPVIMYGVVYINLILYRLKQRRLNGLKYQHGSGQC